MKASSPQGARKTIFWLILALMPLLFFAVLEVMVRMMGLGAHYPLFIPVDSQPGYLQPNPNVVKRYFSRPELAPHVSPDTLYFHAEKPADSQRIVVLGESSAAGFPYGRFGSPSGMLEQRFKFLYPEKNIEVINVAMAAINSYTIRDFTKEVLAIKPDIVLIYAGHNEYLGVMGVGSTLAARDSRWKTLMYISLRHSHLFQLFDSVIAGFRMGDKPNEAVNERTLMARVAANKNIPFDSPAYKQGLRQFEDNMNDIVTAYRNAKVPVVIGTLVSNESDQPPFASQDREDEVLKQHLKIATDLRESGDLDAAKNQLHLLIQKYPQSADTYFALAKTEQAKENYTVARKYYLLAKDYDLLRFRAPEAINSIVNNFSQMSGVFIAQVQQELHEKSVNGITGFDLILEHLHPNADGYFWLTDAYLKSMTANNLLPLVTNTIPVEQVKLLMPVSDIDKTVANWTITSLLSDYPFSDTPKKFVLGELATQESQLAAARYTKKIDWLTSVRQSLMIYENKKDARGVQIVLGQLSDALPMNVEIAAAAAHSAMDYNVPSLMLFYSSRGLRENSKNEDLLMVKAHALYLSQRLPESKKYLEQVLVQNPQNQMAKALLSKPWAISIH